MTRYIRNIRRQDQYYIEHDTTYHIHGPCAGSIQWSLLELETSASFVHKVTHPWGCGRGGKFSDNHVETDHEGHSP